LPQLLELGGTAQHTMLRRTLMIRPVASGT
jgi:hypothetical protein